ncbi:hypothetical protein Acr_05g0010510 [Actinidia rufa]|uniref:Uncharacterized protein n=1 Tax=Actinidia rufa TaxID=165716 RepID=A0A7J0EM79_9ERIC|nr:hypothetical protein Acr_05g0010510 [Actinidia rufa]
MHLQTKVSAPSHRDALHPSTGVPPTPHRGVPQSTSLCELSWLHLSSLVHTTGENTATDQIKSKRDSLWRRHAFCCTAFQNRLGLLPLSFSMDILHWLHYSCLARLPYISQSISLRSCTASDPLGTPALTLRTSVQRLLALSILLVNTTGPMSDSSSSCLDTPLQSPPGAWTPSPARVARDPASLARGRAWPHFLDAWTRVRARGLPFWRLAVRAASSRPRVGAWVLPRARGSAWDLPGRVTETDLTRRCSNGT